MLAVDGTGMSLTFLTEAANISEFKLAIQTIDGISVNTRPLHPRKRPEKLIADKGYDAGWLRNDVRKRGMQKRSNERANV